MAESLKLRDYQIDIANKAVAVLNRHGLVYLALAVRTGKSLTSMYTAHLHGARSVLFLTKKKVIDDITSQYNQMKESYHTTYNLTVSNYEQLHNIKGNFDLYICDESQQLSQYPNPAERTKMLKKMVGSTPVIYLSGTPTAESYSQIFHQFWISDNSPFRQYKNFYQWVKDYVNVKKKYLYNREINDYSNAHKAKIDEATKHLFISLSQEEAGFTESVEEKVHTVKMSPATYNLAESLRKHRIVKNKKGEIIIADTAVKLQQKLHQVYSGTVITEDKTYAIFDDSKVKYIKDTFANDKIAIYYKFISEGELLKHHFNWTSSQEEFNNSTDKTFISQVQSGREGVNLSTADALVMYNIDFSSLSYWQTRARLQTKDRTKAALVHWIFSDGGIEHRIYDVVLDKRDYSLSYFKKDYNL